MSLDPRGKAALALHRFGLGPKLNSIEAIASDPQALFLAELDRPGAGLLPGSFLPTDVAARESHADWEERKRARLANPPRQQNRAAVPDPDQTMAPSQSGEMKRSPEMETASSMETKEKSSHKPGPSVGRKLYLDELAARLGAALDAETGLTERLVWFWSNHFCISATMKAFLPAIAGSYEREAIRPYVLGRFSDMLLAVEQHPAMLTYLDNRYSIGPNSRLARNGKHGINENLAREILELHTLGVRTVYTQQDVTNFANVLTGWTIVGLRDQARGGQFVFIQAWHEPGPQTVIGKSYADTGVEQGRAILMDVARHPATAMHIAKKLAMHFVSDTPPPALIDRIAKTFSDTDGDLKAVTRTLLQSSEAWEEPRTKLKRPGEWIVGALRAAGASHPHPRFVMRAQIQLGEPQWQPPSPKGFSDQSATWIDGIAARLDVANNLAGRLELPDNIDQVVRNALGPLASTATKDTIARAGDRKQALALLFMSPEALMR